MKNIEKSKTIGLIFSIILIFCLVIYIFILKLFGSIDNDYKKLGIKIEDYNIEYSTIYGYDEFSKYKVYKIKIKDYINREIYEVRGGPQNDGTDYYVYEFNEEKGKEIIETLEKNSKWSTNRLDDDILDDFKYNEEVLSIKNGYYHYELVCRTRDESKKYNVTKENATGWEIGVYDADKNMLYYYWRSI